MRRASSSIPEEVDLPGALRLYAQYARAAHMHDSKILYGNIKPHNFLLHKRSDGSLRGIIGDLRLAQLVLLGSHAPVVQSTLYMMARTRCSHCVKVEHG